MRRIDEMSASEGLRHSLATSARDAKKAVLRRDDPASLPVRELKRLI